MISIIIPAYNESTTIGMTLRQIIKCIPKEFEVIVIDGNSADNTEQIVKSFNQVRLLKCSKGRSTQMNFGAQNASNEILLFLHADTVMNSTGIQRLTEKLRSKDVVWGWFSIRLDQDKLVYRAIETLANLRARITGTPLGDHAIFVKKDIFNEVGGFPDIPLFEDLEFVKNIKRISSGTRINASVTTSVRRFQNSGILNTVIRMWMIRLFYYLGFSTRRLAAFYDDCR